MGLIRINGFPMDLAVSESHKFPGEVTKFPVERGADGNDHIRDLPPQITLECIVSDTPTGDLATDPTRTRDDPNAPLPSSEALAKLREIKALRRPVTIETSLGVFESMAFVDLDVPRDKDKNNGLFFTATFEFFNQTTNKRTRVRVKTPMAGAGGKTKPKATIGRAYRIDAEIRWFHGTPAGTPWRDGNPIELIGVNYSRPNGLTQQDAVILGTVAPSTPFVTYVYLEGQLAGTPVIGIPRSDLIKDLERDNAVKRADQARVLAAPGSDLNKAQNLPPGLDLSRFTRPPPPTFPDRIPATFPAL